MPDRTEELLLALGRIESALRNQVFPVPNPTTPSFKDVNGYAVSAVLDASGNIPTSGGGGGGSTTTVVQANAGTNLNTSLLTLDATTGATNTAVAGVTTAVGIATTELATINTTSAATNTALAALKNPTLSNSTSTAYETYRIAKSTAAVLYGFTGYNALTTAQFIQVHDTTTVPADGQAPIITFTVPATSNFSGDWGVRGRATNTGLVILNSTTGPTKTAGTASFWVDVQYA